MTTHNITKPTDALNEILEGCSLTLSPLAASLPTDSVKLTPLNPELTERAKQFLSGVPLDVYHEIQRLAVRIHENTKHNLEYTDSIPLSTTELLRSTTPLSLDELERIYGHHR